jgi:DNA-binding CsgD family transcriptional regulator
MLVGRRAERTRLNEVLEGLPRGRSAALVVLGEPGVGKTALLDSARAAAGLALVLSARGYEEERELPFAGVSLLLAPVADRLDVLPSPQRRALEAALGRGPAGGPDRFAAYAGVLSLLAASAEAGPMLALVDDAHWLDLASAEALVFAARRLAGEGIGMLFAARETERAGFDPTGLPELRLAGLETEAVVELLTDRSGHPVAPAVAARLRDATAGNPLALSELAGLLSAGQLKGTQPLQDPLPTGEDVERAFGRRIASLPNHTQRALAVAAADAAVPLNTLGRALGELELDPSALEPAEKERLVSTTASGVEFRHPLIRSIAYQRTAGSERRAAHRALADALALTGDPGRRALHLARAATGPDEAVARELEAIARSARGRVAPEPAARMLEAAARLTPARELRIERLLEAAQTFGVAAHLDPAGRLLDELLSEALGDPCLRADVQRLRARLETMTGGQHQLLGLLRDEAEHVVQHDPNRAASLLADAAFLAVMDGELRLALELATRARSLGARLDGLAELEVYQSLGGALVLAGRIDEGLEHLERAEQLLEREHTGLDAMAWALAQAYHWAGHYEHSRRMLGATVARARNEGVVAALPAALAVMSWVDFRLGDWSLAHTEVSESLSLAAVTGQRALAAFSLMRLAELEAARGAARGCRTHVQESVALAEELGVGSMHLMAGPVLGLLDVGCGPTEDTIERLESTGRDCLDRGLEEPMVLPWAQELTEAYVRLGDREGAQRTLAVLERQARQSGLPTATAVASRYRGLLTDDDAKAERLFLRALELHERLPTPFDRARTELCFGERLRRGRRRREARVQLRSALATFDRLGAAPWSERARRELAASGERTRRRAADTRDELTPQELQVAIAVAEGATNREAAAQLFVSPKTIETHLSHIYRKLGVRSRTELARSLHGAVGVAVAEHRPPR